MDQLSESKPVHAELPDVYWLGSSRGEQANHCLSEPERLTDLRLEILRSVMAGFATGTVVVATVVSICGR
ncbi:hypothetical protein [Streptomyces sp. WM6378]|uniref:hypothetical protein n=1 Tax=Streptomyces sp. WM6378 TaxID=1415557 RepID=UPI0006C3D554|nr:hypothetical protein [Streptomyces sp. WM6378]KOU34961.1 hypothetical protein ADK54_39290 [Streptomyces sp. WM6378]